MNPCRRRRGSASTSSNGGGATEGFGPRGSCASIRGSFSVAPGACSKSCTPCSSATSSCSSSCAVGCRSRAPGSRSESSNHTGECSGKSKPLHRQQCVSVTLLTAPQSPQGVRCSGDPHSLQNFAPAGFRCSQKGQSGGGMQRNRHRRKRPTDGSIPRLLPFRHAVCMSPFDDMRVSEPTLSAESLGSVCTPGVECLHRRGVARSAEKT